jgi:hypothetical protein
LESQLAAIAAELNHLRAEKVDLQEGSLPGSSRGYGQDGTRSLLSVEARAGSPPGDTAALHGTCAIDQNSCRGANVAEKGTPAAPGNQRAQPAQIEPTYNLKPTTSRFTQPVAAKLARQKLQQSSVRADRGSCRSIRPTASDCGCFHRTTPAFSRKGGTHNAEILGFIQKAIKLTSKRSFHITGLSGLTMYRNLEACIF